jgi:hypothetical protein
MANEDQLNILKQGVKVWNQWREEYSDEKIDLRKANLSRTFFNACAAFQALSSLAIDESRL